jgi:hypothetical protein
VCQLAWRSGSQRRRLDIPRCGVAAAAVPPSLRLARRTSRSEHYSGPASGVAGDRVTIWPAGAIGAQRRERSAGQFVKELVHAQA